MMNRTIKLMNKFRLRINNYLYIHRLDILAFVVISLIINYMFSFLYSEGVIIFSDVDFPYDTRDYLNQIIGIWNHRFNSTAMLNTPRLLSILPSYIISSIFNYNGDLFLKLFIFQNLYLAAISFYIFIKRLLRVYYNPNFNLSRILIMVVGSLYYGLNPWVMFRIQHIYLLVGYSLFPFVLLQFFKVFDHKFQVVVIPEYNPLENKVYKQNIKDMILLGLGISVSAGAIHYFFYTILLFAGLVLLMLLKYTLKYRKAGLKTIQGIYLVFIKKLLILGILVLGFSAYWFFIYVGSIILGTQASQNNVNVLDTYTAFSRHSSIKNVLYLNSYWWPMVSMKMFDIYFYISGGVILVISLIGFSLSFKKQHIILFLGLLGVGLSVLATGVNYEIVAPVFLRFVELPVIGSIFRDPNKLVGILVLCIASSFVFGADMIYTKLMLIGKVHLVTLALHIVLFTSLLIYITSMQEEYVKHFYAPVEEPDEYVELNEFIKSQEYDYAIYLPLSEEMLQETKIATPYWNDTQNKVKKATGDVHIYNSSINTLFQYEGNDLAIAYYLRYIQYLIDENRTNMISDYIQALGSNILIYHDEYLEQTTRQDLNISIIEEDPKMLNIFTNNIFSIYEIDKPIQNSSQEYIYTTGGLEKISLYQKIEGYTPLSVPTVFGYQDNNSTDILQIADGYIDTLNETELLLSYAEDEVLVYPFEWINEGNPFLKWSKTYMTSTDWIWYLESQDFIDHEYNFDRNGGLAVTYSTAMLDVLPYEKSSMVGEIVMDFDTMLEQEIFFKPDNKELFEVQGNPYNEGNQIQTIQGVLAKGDPKDIWQVAKSGFIEANENTPYGYELSISGRLIESMHLKARFFDENEEEIGVSYVVAPEENINFDTVNFVGEVISPNGTKWMRLDLLSYQKPESKSYWWIHDLNIYDFSEYKNINQIKGKYNSDEEGLYHIYLRSFQSLNGGLVTIGINGEDFTYDSFNNKSLFKWQNIGSISLPKGAIDVDILNNNGFNAINAIAIISDEELESYRTQMKLDIRLNKQLTTIESSLDLLGNTQLLSDRTYSHLSYGKGIAVADEQLYVDLDILKDGSYQLDSSIVFPLSRGEVEIELYKEDVEVFKQEVGHESKQVYKLDLEAGSYRLVYNIDSQATNYVPITSLHKFNPAEILVENFIDDPYMMDCSECESISLDMMNHQLKGNEITITYEPTCSCDWYIYSSDKIDVEVGEEWYVSYRAVSEEITKRHGKMIYLDHNDEPIDYDFINEVEEKDKYLLNDYEQIIEIPENTVSMYLQFWARGNKKLEGYLTIKDLEVYRYRDLVTLDHTIIMDQNIDLSVSQTDKIDYVVNEGSIIYEETSGMVSTFLSPSAFWKNEDSQQYKLNSISGGYRLNSNQALKIYIPLFRIYIVGLVVTILTTLLSIGYYIVRRKS